MRLWLQAAPFGSDWTYARKFMGGEAQNAEMLRLDKGTNRRANSLPAYTVRDSHMCAKMPLGPRSGTLPSLHSGDEISETRCGTQPGWLPWKSMEVARGCSFGHASTTGCRFGLGSGSSLSGT